MVETTKHVRIKIANWNMSAQEWLRRCIYERSHFKNKSFGQMFTFIVSSFWHGYYGGYYVSFFLWFCHMHVSQMIFKESKKEGSKYTAFYKKLGIVGRVLLWIAANVMFTICGISFQVLSFEQSWNILASMHYFPVILYFSLIALFTFAGTKTKRSKFPLQKPEEESSSLLTKED